MVFFVVGENFSFFFFFLFCYTSILLKLWVAGKREKVLSSLPCEGIETVGSENREVGEVWGGGRAQKFLCISEMGSS